MEELNSGKGGGGMEIDDKGGVESKNEGVVVRWEKFLPRMVMRVLLVESDDSTRQIITALLRKCSYKVAAVADGLKAWELLKGRPHNIDLILTEVELPSVSGFALLTLIAEHEICKNIPVIMMSAHDSVNTVYKCMLRGAADFLVKPVRKNELKNLWQHVWRRQNSLSEGAQATSDAQQKVEATAENNATSNNSSGYEACIQRNRECIEKGSDAQSSCAYPDLEAEEANLEDRQDLTRDKSMSIDIDMQKVDQFVKESEQMPMHDNGAHGSVALRNTNAMNTTSPTGNAAAESHQEYANVASEVFDKNNIHMTSSREAIDLIGAFDKYPKCSYKSLGSTYVTNKVDSSLDLTLRRSHPTGSVNQVTDDGHTLKQSDASAFSRYVSRRVQPLHSASCNQQRGYETSSDKHMSNQALDYNSDTRAPTISPDNHMMSPTTGQLGQTKNQFSYPQQRVIPVTVPVRGVNLQNLSKAYGSVLPPVFCTQPRHSSLQSPSSSAHQDPTFQANQKYQYDPQTRSSPQLQYMMDQNIHNGSSDQMEHKQGQKLDLPQDRGHFSSATDPSGNSSFCDATLNRINSINSGSNGIVNSLPNIKLGPESGNESTQDGSCQRSIQREAALTKFRMKRKDRCYEKKVRYESRKKLAEQRPRIKGQFVRQLQTSGPSVESDNHIFNSSAS